MAKQFYSLQEACEKLGKSEDELRSMVRDGQLREFRDAGKVNYRVDEIDKLARSTGGGSEIVLEPADDGDSFEDTGGSIFDLASTGDATGIGMGGTGLDLSSSGSDIISLEETDMADTSVGAEPKKDDTVVSSVGVSVFEDDEDEADPVAETVVNDSGMGLDGVGSGSGLLDLTRESDDTAFNAQLLDEIYDDSSADQEADTKAGLADVAAGVQAAEDEPADLEPADTGSDFAGVPVTTAASVPMGDPVAGAMTGLLAAGMIVLCVSGLAVASLMRGGVPSLLEMLQPKMWMFGAGSLGVAVVAAGIGYVLGKRG